MLGNGEEGHVGHARRRELDMDREPRWQGDPRIGSGVVPSGERSVFGRVACIYLVTGISGGLDRSWRSMHSICTQRVSVSQSGFFDRSLAAIVCVVMQHVISGAGRGDWGVGGNRRHSLMIWTRRVDTS
jgi:hypothetical protein